MSDSRDLFLKYFSQVPEITARAPGRVEFIGNHTDYNGGEVLGAAINRYLTISLGPRNDGIVKLISDSSKAGVSVPLNEITPQSGTGRWANYPLGVLKVMMAAGLPVTGGFNLAVSSEIPDGAGLSSSAAFELATAFALQGLFPGFKADLKALVRLCRKAENEFVGMPCGILDQGVSGFGKSNHLVRIDCKFEFFSTVAVPAGIHLWIFNSNKKHSLVDSFYEKRHRECSEAFEVLRRSQLGAECLCDIDPLFVELAHYRMPREVFMRARHVTEENQRVKLVVDALSNGNMKRVGELLYASHESSRSLFQNSCDELDALVYQMRLQPNVFGARLTGGGFGGAVLGVTNEKFSLEQANEVCEQYEARFALRPTVFHVQAADGAGIIA